MSAGLYWAPLQCPNGTPEMIGFPDLPTREQFATAAAARGVSVSTGAHPATRGEAFRVAQAALARRRFILREWRGVVAVLVEEQQGGGFRGSKTYTYFAFSFTPRDGKESPAAA